MVPFFDEGGEEVVLKRGYQLEGDFVGGEGMSDVHFRNAIVYVLHYVEVLEGHGQGGAYWIFLLVPLGLVPGYHDVGIWSDACLVASYHLEDLVSSR